MGPGAPFEVAEEQVLGARHDVFVQRFPHLRALFEEGTARNADRLYLVDGGRTVTFGEAAQLVANTAAALHDEYGIGRGDRVAIAAANRYDHVIAIWGVIVLGAVVVELNGWWTGAELEHGIRLTDPKLLIGDDARLERLDGVVPDLQRRDLDHVSGAWFTGTASLPTTPIDEDDPFVILFTSGTTGRPKGAVLTHRNNIHWTQSIALRNAAGGATSGDSCEIAALPLFHVSGLTAAAIPAVATGAKLVYPPSAGRWSPELQLRMTEEHRVTAWRLVPTQAWRMLECPDRDRYDVSSLRSIIGGGSVWSPQLLERLATQWPHARAGMINGFGMTETCGTGASAVMPGVLDHPGSVGSPPPLADLRVCAPGTDAQVDDGEDGEIQIRSTSVFLGYDGDLDATRAVLGEDRWYRSGDFGRIDDGRLYLVGRRSDLIIRGGENISPAEVEDRLRAHPDIADVVVIGVPDRELGEVVTAIAVRREGSQLDADGVRRWAAAALAPFKVPVHVEFRVHLPRNAMGKVMKRLLDSGEDVPFAES